MEDLKFMEHSETPTALFTSKAKIYRNFQYYLTIPPESHNPANTLMLAEACACGYIDALHWAHKYSPVLAIDKPYLYERIKADVKAIPDYAHIPELSACCQYLDHHTDSHFHIATEVELTKAFLTGYVAALHWACKYSEALYLTGDMLSIHVLADLYAVQKKRSDAHRACVRIVANAYPGLNKAELRSMIFDGQCIDDNDKPVTTGESQPATSQT